MDGFKLKAHGQRSFKMRTTSSWRRTVLLSTYRCQFVFINADDTLDFSWGGSSGLVVGWNAVEVAEWKVRVLCWFDGRSHYHAIVPRKVNSHRASSPYSFQDLKTINRNADVEKMVRKIDPTCRGQFRSVKGNKKKPKHWGCQLVRTHMIRFTPFSI